jgi:hypothetical protein
VIPSFNCRTLLRMIARPPRHAVVVTKAKRMKMTVAARQLTHGLNGLRS